MSKDFYRGIIIKYLFMVLKHVGFYVNEKFDFDHCDLHEVKTLVVQAYRMIFNRNYRWSLHPDLDMHDLIAIVLYRLKVPHASTLFIDEVTINYGYGFCRNVGTFQFQIPHEFMDKNTVVESCPVFHCDLDTQIESIELHAYKNRVKDRKVIHY